MHIPSAFAGDSVQTYRHRSAMTYKGLLMTYDMAYAYAYVYTYEFARVSPEKCNYFRLGRGLCLTHAGGLRVYCRDETKRLCQMQQTSDRA